MEACREETSFECLSLDYNKSDQSCDLSDKDRNDIGLKTNYPDNPYDYYERKPIKTKALQDFQRLREAPDLNTVWDSNLGPVYWIGGYFGPDDAITPFAGQLGITREENDIYLYGFSGKILQNDGRIDDNKPRGIGDVSIEFSHDKQSFSGKIKRNGKETKWTGRYRAGAEFSAGKVNRSSAFYNDGLEFQVSEVNRNARAYNARIEPTKRCDKEMIDFLQKQELPVGSISRLCKN